MDKSGGHHTKLAVEGHRYSFKPKQETLAVAPLHRAGLMSHVVLCLDRRPAKLGPQRP